MAPHVANQRVLTPPTVALIDPPGESAEKISDLTEQEQQEVETLADEFRKAQQSWNAPARHKAFTQLLDAALTEKDPDRAHVLGALWHEHKKMEETLHPIACRIVAPRIAVAALRIVAGETRKILDMAGELNRMEPEIRAALDRLLGFKGKAVVGILEELASLEGLSLGVDFGNTLLYEELSNSDTTKSACREFAGDPDMQVLAKAYALAGQIREAEEGK